MQVPIKSVAPNGLADELVERVRKEFQHSADVEALRERSRSFHILEVGHTREAGRCEKKGRFFGLLVVMITTAIGTAAFAQLGEGTGTAAKIVVGSVGALAAVLAAFKENAAYGKSSADHQKAGADFGALHHTAEEMLLKYQRDADFRVKEFDEKLQTLDKDRADLMRKSISLSGRAYDWAENWVDAHSARR